MISNNLYTDIARTYSKWTPGDNPFATTSDRFTQSQLHQMRIESDRLAREIYGPQIVTCRYCEKEADRPSDWVEVISDELGNTELICNPCFEQLDSTAWHIQNNELTEYEAADAKRVAAQYREPKTDRQCWDCGKIYPDSERNFCHKCDSYTVYPMNAHNQAVTI